MPLRGKRLQCLPAHLAQQVTRQWSALAGGGNVSAPKVGDGGNAGQLGEGVGVADLQGERGVGLGAVAECLAVGPDRANVAVRDAGRDSCPTIGRKELDG